MIICPKCKEELIKEDRSYKCKNNHTYDVSKSGHVNLLLDNQKNSKHPGDDKDMVISRKKFLEKDYYKGISNKLNEIIKEYSRDKDEINILDIGSGEGYYTGNLKSSLDEAGIKNNILGIDISKDAMIQASKAYKDITWVVASASNIPVQDESLDFIICMFAKIVPEEKMRTLKKDGRVIIVSTGENHLLEMKEVVYDEIRKEAYSPIEDLRIFQYEKTINLCYEENILENDSIKNLFNMTPYRWRSPKIGVDRLFSLENLRTKIEVNFDIFKK